MVKDVSDIFFDQKGSTLGRFEFSKCPAVVSRVIY